MRRLVRQSPCHNETIQLWDAISISAGVRGTQMVMRPEDYLRVTGAVMADIARGN